LSGSVEAGLEFQCQRGTALFAQKRALFEKNAKRAHFKLKILKEICLGAQGNRQGTKAVEVGTTANALDVVVNF
jgi:hypothetical protein